MAAVSNWFLYIGVFLCATGFGVAIGAIFIFYWGIKKLEEAKQGNSYTENNFTVDIDHYHAGTSGDGGDSRATVDDHMPREFISKETLEDSR